MFQMSCAKCNPPVLKDWEDLWFCICSPIRCMFYVQFVFSIEVKHIVSHCINIFDPSHGGTWLFADVGL